VIVAVGAVPVLYVGNDCVPLNWTLAPSRGNFSFVLYLKNVSKDLLPSVRLIVSSDDTCNINAEINNEFPIQVALPGATVINRQMFLSPPRASVLLSPVLGTCRLKINAFLPQKINLKRSPGIQVQNLALYDTAQVNFSVGSKGMKLQPFSIAIQSTSPATDGVQVTWVSPNGASYNCIISGFFSPGGGCYGDSNYRIGSNYPGPALPLPGPIELTAVISQGFGKLEAWFIVNVSIVDETPIELKAGTPFNGNLKGFISYNYMVPRSPSAHHCVNITFNYVTGNMLGMYWAANGGDNIGSFDLTYSSNQGVVIFPAVNQNNIVSLRSMSPAGNATYTATVGYIDCPSEN
jgi:hypothetical protein